MNPLHELIRKLPARVEFLVVITWAFGLAIFESILSLGRPAGEVPAVYQSSALIGELVFELLQSLFLVWFLRIRGWTLEKLGLVVNLRATLLGLGLLVIAGGVWLGVQHLADWLMPAHAAQSAQGRYPDAPDTGMGLVFLASVVNGIFEEVIVAGYVIAAVTQVRGTWTAINVSTGLRLLYHLHQGPIALLTVVPLGLLFGYTFARTRLLWALIVAHIVLDIVVLALAR